MTATPTDRDRAEAHKLLVWAEGFTRGLTWDQKIDHIMAALATARRDALKPAIAAYLGWSEGPEPDDAMQEFGDYLRENGLLAATAIRQPGKEGDGNG